MKNTLKNVLIGIGAVHVIGWGLYSIYFEWKFKNDNSAVKSYFLSDYVGVAKGLFWEYHLYRYLNTENLSQGMPHNLTDKEVFRVQEIVITVMRNSDANIKDLKKEYWSIATRAYPNDLEKVRNSFLASVDGDQFNYSKQFWIDAMMSYRQGRVYLSNEYLKLESKLLKSGELPQERAKANRKLLKTIALKEPTVIDGIEAVINEEYIQASIDNTEGAKIRLKKLLDYKTP